VDYVICFHCYQIYIFADGEHTVELTTRSPQRVLDQIFADAGIPLKTVGGSTE
jgi:hypothetical protein